MKETIVDQCLVYVDRLHFGKEHLISLTIPPDFIAIDEEELKFPCPVEIEGKAYLADGNELIVHLNIKTHVEIPCSICNSLVKTVVELNDFYDIHPVSEIKNRIYDFRGAVREELLLNTPHTVECNHGSCPKRDEYKKYFKSGRGAETDDDRHYHPFENL